MELGSDRLSLFPSSENALPEIFSVDLSAATFPSNPDEIKMFSAKGGGGACAYLHCDFWPGVNSRLGKKTYPVGIFASTSHVAKVASSALLSSESSPTAPPFLSLCCCCLAEHVWMRSLRDLPCEINSHSILSILPSLA